MTTPIQHEQQVVTLEQDMQAWGERFRVTQAAMSDRAREAFDFRQRWVTSGRTGDFSTALAQHARISRTTAWRAWRAGYALSLGAAVTADQGDLLEAARAFDLGATPDEVNAALAEHAARDLANTLDQGSVGRRMTPEAAQLREQVQKRLGTLGLDHLPPAERDELVWRAFLAVSDETLRGIVQGYRKNTENLAEEVPAWPVGATVFYIGPRRPSLPSGTPFTVIESQHAHLTRITTGRMETSVPHDQLSLEAEVPA